MGLRSCKLCDSCLRGKDERGASGHRRRECECDDWRRCPDRCCDVCCQMCVDVCSGLCSGDSSYTFFTLCLGLAQSCVSLFTNSQRMEILDAQQVDVEVTPSGSRVTEVETSQRVTHGQRGETRSQETWTAGEMRGFC